MSKRLRFLTSLLTAIAMMFFLLPNLAQGGLVLGAQDTPLPYSVEGDSDEGVTDEGNTDEGDTDEGNTDEGDTDEGDTDEGDGEDTEDPLLTSSISGRIFIDSNGNGLFDDYDWAIGGAKIALEAFHPLWGPDPIEIILETETDGTYCFDDLTGMRFTLTNLNWDHYLSGETMVGTGFDEDGTNAGNGVIEDIKVNSPANGTDYNFAMSYFKAKYVSKNEFIQVVPEPATWCGLLSLLGTFFWMRRRR